MLIRPECAADAQTIRSLVTAAFHDAPHRSGTEGNIIDILRAGDALTPSLVAIEDDRLVGHVALSPVTIAGSASDWFGLGPVAVERGSRRQGVGHRLINAGLEQMRACDAGGCVVVGDPTYYARFDFELDPDLMLPGFPADYFLSLHLRGNRPAGQVAYHPAFSAV